MLHSGLFFIYEVIILGYIYFCRVVNQPKKGYIGQDSRDIASLARIREHIDAAYKPGFTIDNCAQVIRVSGCCAVEWAFFDSLQNYGLPSGVVQDFKKHGTFTGSDLDLAEVLHIIGSHMTQNVSSSYNRLIGGQNFDLIYNGPIDNKYGLALQKIFGKTELPEIKINRGNPAAAWQKAIYPGQYQVLKEFVNSYITTTLKDETFLNKMYKSIENTKELQKIVIEYIKQYVEHLSNNHKVFVIEDNNETLSLGKKLTFEIEDIIEETLGEQENIQQVIESLKEYKIRINKSYFDGKELSLQIKTKLQEKLTQGKTRQQLFADMVAKEVLTIGPKNKVFNTNDIYKIENKVMLPILKKAIRTATHRLFDKKIPLQIGELNHSFFYKKDITPPREEKPLWAQLLENYKISGGVTTQQQNLIFQWSRYRIYRNIDNIIYDDYNQAHDADKHKDFLMARIHSASPFNYINFEYWTDGIHEVLTAYTIDYKDYRGAPVEYNQGIITRGGSGDSKDYVTRDDLFNQGRPILYSGNMTRLAFYPQDTKRYY